MPNKTNCPITRDQFKAKAKDLVVNIGGSNQVANVKEFSTGSLGWFLNNKVVVNIDGVNVTCQVGLNITVVGSKELPK